MRWALITDIHANRQAFEAVLADARAQGATRYALLGDFVGYGADPAWVLDQVVDLVTDGAIAVMGNHDEAVARGSMPGMHPDARAVVDWTRAQLSEEHLRFLSRLPLQAHGEPGHCLFVHANAFDPMGWEYVQGRAEAVKSLHASAARIQVCGHMHEPMLFHLSGTGKAGDFRPVAGVPMPLPAHRQWLAIPGSCGQPRDGNPAACYALLDPGKSDLDDARMTFQRVAYDVEAACAALRATDLPPLIAERLARRLTLGE
ncbi:MULTISPECIES: metallophosphoesterase [unclassified Roseateles]|uniref:metallophosphoesterase family protein n=1 Tax=unclassified Roseateles TaxID=2626991 RepID=UPI0006F33BC0|nr:MULTISPECIES: metallophosphoesterase family protein [unclassified Roseateles]KQW43825.1 metallophosphoesterase [Pelomonas sp. Root405]KRA71574.1 metallophosphoesterase [Pelomonas sp. Root662]